MSKDGKKVIRTIHRLVAVAFVDNPDNKPQVNHKDENTVNNIYSNLEWVTVKENINYGNRNAKVSLKLGKKVKCIETNKIYNSTMEATRILHGYNNHKQGHIADCCRGVRKSAFGYHWKYIGGKNEEE